MHLLLQEYHTSPLLPYPLSPIQLPPRPVHLLPDSPNHIRIIAIDPLVATGSQAHHAHRALIGRDGAHGRYEPCGASACLREQNRIDRAQVR